KTCTDIDDPVVIAQEVDLDYSASVEGVLIPMAWIQASVDSHKILGLEPSGVRVAALDIADEGKDKNSFCGRYGFLVEFVEAWSGKGSDTFESTEKAFALADLYEFPEVNYDADGLGAGVRGDARIINAKRRGNKLKSILFSPFRGSGAVAKPKGNPFSWDNEQHQPGEKGRTNHDFF